MAYKSRLPKQPKKRGLARAGASLMIRGISKYLGVGKSTNRSQNPSQNKSHLDPLGRQPTSARSPGHAPSPNRLASTQGDLVTLANEQRNGEMVLFDARIVKVFPDDNHGDRHQRFLIAVDFMPSPIETVLIAHNIDLAPRIPAQRGAIARFYGQYEYNNKGGLLHWTHHDPSNWREGGWIEIHGKRYD